MKMPLLAVFFLAVPAFAQKPAPKESPSKAAPAPGGKTQVTWLGHAAFEIVTRAGTVVVVDPWLANPKYPAGRARPEKIDVILVTHGHADHLGDAVELAQKSGAPVVGSHELTLWVGAQGVKNVVGLNSGGTWAHKDVTVYAVDAMHSSGITGKDGAVIYAGAPLGYVIDVEDGPRFYHAGDTNVFPGMELVGKLHRPDVALLPIGGHYTMGPREAAMAVRLLRVKRVWPMHWGTFPLLAGNPDALKAELANAGVAAEVLTPGIGTAVTF